VAVVGITGPIGAGKSIVADWFRDQGAEMLDADRMAHRLLEPSQPTFRRIVEAFGGDVLDDQGRIDRRRLGQAAFQCPERLQRLNGIVHPPLVKQLRERMEGFRASPSANVLAIDAALLFQWGLEQECDLVIWLDAPREVRLRRTLEHGRFDATEFERRDRLQQPLFDGAVENQSIVKINNTGTCKELIESIQTFWKRVSDNEIEKHDRAQSKERQSNRTELRGRR